MCTVCFCVSIEKIVAKHDPNQMVKEMSKAVKDAENDSEVCVSCTYIHVCQNV